MHDAHEHARDYAACRHTASEVLTGLIEEGDVRQDSQVVEAGCGSGNYLRADLARGPVVANASYVLLWGRRGSLPELRARPDQPVAG